MKRLSPPAELSSSSRKLFRRLCQEYAISDLGGLECLRSGLKSLDRAEQAEALIARDGALVADRFGQRKAHPLSAVARDSRAAWQAALKSLNLAIGDPPKAGRPGGGEL